MEVGGGWNCTAYIEGDHAMQHQDLGLVSQHMGLLSGHNCNVELRNFWLQKPALLKNKNVVDETSSKIAYSRRHQAYVSQKQHSSKLILLQLRCTT